MRRVVPVEALRPYAGDAIVLLATGSVAVVGRGRQWVDVRVSAWETVSTPRGDETALALRETVRHTYTDGNRKGYEITSWLVPDLGLVRAEGDLIWRNREGRETRRVPIGAGLSHGVVEGQTVGG